MERVAIFRAGGHQGEHFVTTLLKTGKYTVTALTRTSSTKLPDGVKIIRVNYDDEPSFMKALTGQQFLVITLSVQGAPGIHTKLVRAAAKAGIRYIMPNVYGRDFLNKKRAT